ncbi:MAG: hypothetical protein MJZ42_04860 [Bacteroidales bacterium]|nr:hypothetical protein [Bacteroidales bacterium]
MAFDSGAEGKADAPKRLSGEQVADYLSERIEDFPLPRHSSSKLGSVLGLQKVG